MNISNVIVITVVIIILLSISIFLIELFIPLNIKFEMNSICRSYLFEIEESGDLNNYSKNELINKLENIGLKDIEICIEKNGSEFGDKIILNITSDYIKDTLISIFKRNSERIIMSYERKITIKKIIN